MANSLRAAVIVGGTQGLGYAIARQLLNEGSQAVAITGRDAAKGEAAARALHRNGASIEFIRADISDVGQCAGLIDEAAARLGPLDGLVNSAACCNRGTLLDTTPEICA